METKKLFTMLLAATALCACSSGGDGTPETPVDPPTPETPDKMAINISTTLTQPDGTRVTDYAFEKGDRIGLYVVNRQADGNAAALRPTGNHVDNMLFSYNATWTPATPIYWFDDKTHADFYLYYPYTADVTNVEAMPFAVKADQSAEDSYKASDLLLGSAADIAPTETAVSIVAKHAMSQMLITLVPGNGFTEETLAAASVGVKVNNIVTGATVNIAKGTVTATGAAETVTPLKTGDFSYKALIVPQTVAEGNLITVNVDGRDFNLPKAFTFESGHLHRFTVTLSKTSNGINVSIDRWQDDGTDNGGTAE